VLSQDESLATIPPAHREQLAVATREPKAQRRVLLLLQPGEAGEFVVAPQGYTLNSWSPDYPHQNFDAFIKAGRLRPLAVTTATRQSVKPDVPTIKEASGIDFSAEIWYGLVGPAKMPAALVSKISEDLRKVVADPDTQARLRDAGVQSAFLNAADMGELMKSNVATWRAVINRVQISLD
jgi:hypothetical protein